MTNGKLVLIGRAEMVSRSQRISSSYSCNDPCPPYYGGDLNPFPPTVVINDTTTTTVWETAYYDSGYVAGPYSTTASWTVADSIATLDPNYGHVTTATGVIEGSTNLHGFVAIQQDYGWDGLNCYEYGTYEEAVDAPVDVLRVQYLRVVTDSGNVDFIGFGGDNFNATLVVPANSSICTGDTFSMILRLKKSSAVTLFPPSDTRNFVDTPDDSQYRVNGGGLQEHYSETPYFSISLKRINPSNPNRHIRAQVAGSDFAGSFTSRGFVTINCQ